jgi:hypothetical protein
MFTERTERAVRGADQVTDTATICSHAAFRWSVRTNVNTAEQG